MADWIICGVCDAEYKVLTTEPLAELQFCPFCGSETEVEDDFEEDADEDEE